MSSPIERGTSVRSAPDLTKPAGLEKKLVDVELVSEYTELNERLLIFHAKDNVLRLVVVRELKDGAGVIDRVQSYVDLEHDSFVPMYTVVDKSGTSEQWNFTISDSKAGSVAYQLPSRRDVHKVQKAFTGCNVMAYSDNIHCAVTYQRFPRDKQFIGNGEVQIWCQQSSAFHKISTWPSLSSQFESQFTGLTSSSRNTFTSILSQKHPDIVSILTTEAGEDTMLVELPPPPLLVGFMKDKDGYYVWQIECKY
jgi:hypothetical protein